MISQFVYLTLLPHLLLAEDAQPEPASNALMRMLFPLVMIFLLFYFIMIRPQRKKDEEFKNLLSNLKENDHVVTIGGIYGVVTNVQRDADRITLRVDESNGTKLRVTRSAIARVITDEPKDDSASAGKK